MQTQGFSNFATKNDVKNEVTRLEGKIDRVEGRLNSKIDNVEERLNSKIDNVEARLSAKIDSAVSSLLKFIIPILGGQTVMFVGYVVFKVV